MPVAALSFMLLLTSSEPFFPTVRGDTIPHETPPLHLTVVIGTWVGSNGRVMAATMLRPSGIAQLDSAALACVHTSVYEPATLFGRCVAGTHVLTFRLRSISRFPAALIALPDTPPGPGRLLFCTWPRPTHVPPLLAHAGSTLVEPVLDARHVVRAARLRRSSGHSALDSAAVASAASDSGFFMRESAYRRLARPLLDYCFTFACDGIAPADSR